MAYADRAGSIAIAFGSQFPIRAEKMVFLAAGVDLRWDGGGDGRNKKRSIFFAGLSAVAGRRRQECDRRGGVSFNRAA